MAVPALRLLRANYVFAGPTSGTGAPSFRALVAGDYPAMIGANGSTAGTAGAVPGPAATDNVKFLRGDGTWAAPAAAALVQLTRFSTTAVVL